MPFELRPESGILFKNDRKEKASHPDYQGEALIDGAAYYMSAWIKDGKKGKFMSFSFKPKNVNGSPKNRPEQDSDDAPF